MSVLYEEHLNLFLMAEKLWLLTRPVGSPVYDFAFEQLFQCEHKWQLPETLTAIARIGAIGDYETLYSRLQQEVVQLINNPAEHLRASELPSWYPLINGLTPRSMWFPEMPTLKMVQEDFEFPIFIKGARQTSKHQKHLSIINTPTEFERLQDGYINDPILHWQAIVIREYVELRQVKGGDSDTIPPSFEFRTFWYQGQCVGAGRYWLDVPDYNWTAEEKRTALNIAKAAATGVAVPFLVIDMAQRIDGQWIVIECNDAQESGYGGVSPFALWKNILSIS